MVSVCVIKNIMVHTPRSEGEGHDHVSFFLMYL